MPIIEQYVGKVTAIGNSKGIRLDAMFFKSHPEFNGDVRATVLTNGQVLLSSKQLKTSKKPIKEPVMQAFLQFLVEELMEHPDQIIPANKAQLTRIRKLVAGVKTD